jgi:hypothetical protein
MKDHHELAMEHFAQQTTWLEQTGGYAKDMTLRDHFAGLAMQGLFASDAKHYHEDADIFDVMAEAAYKTADAMLKERNK